MRGFNLSRHGAVRLAAVAGLVVAFAGCEKKPPAMEPVPTWSISGTVSGDVSAGVTVRILGENRTAITDSLGRWEIGDLVDGTYTVEAALAGYAFSPPTQAVLVNGANVTGVNFTSRLGIAITGQVTSGTGEAAPGVTVTLVGVAPVAAPVTVTTDETGSYTFDGIVAGDYLVTPSLAGGWTFAPSDCFVTVGSTGVTGPNFTSLAPTYVVSGTITGSVTVGVTVTLSGGADAVAVTDAAGKYSFSGLAAGSYVVTPSRPGYAFSPGEREVPIVAASAPGVDFVAVAVHKIAGRVSGAVLGGVDVTLTDPLGAASATVTTDASGYFEFPGLLNGNYTVTASLEGYTFTPASRNVTLSGTDKTTENFAAVAVTTYSVTGAVSGAVQVGVTMTLASTVEGGTTRVTTTGVAGAFTFTGVPSGDYMLIPSLEDYLFDDASRLVVVSGASVAGQNFTASVNPTARTITGTVAGEVTGVTVTLVGIAPVTAAVTTTTDAAGRFAFRSLADGVYRVTPSHAAFSFAPANCWVTVSGPSVTNVAFTATAVPHQISGRVTGAVIANVTIDLAGAATGTTVTDGSGNYAFTGLPNGAYTVTASLAGFTFSPAEASVTLQGADSPGVDFVAAANHRIAGTISGDVLAGMKVALSGATTDEFTVDGTGIFAFLDLPDGTYVVTPSLAGYTFSPASLTVMLSGADVTTANFTATLVPTYTVSGTVSGSIQAGVAVSLSGAAVGTTTTDGGGAYSFTGLYDGSYMVIPAVAGHAFTPASRAFRVNGADVTGQNFTAAVAP